MRWCWVVVVAVCAYLRARKCQLRAREVCMPAPVGVYMTLVIVVPVCALCVWCSFGHRYEQALQVLRDAHDLMRSHTDMPLVEALERADWQSPARLRTIGNLGRLLVWQKCAGDNERKAFTQVCTQVEHQQHEAALLDH